MRLNLADGTVSDAPSTRGGFCELVGSTRPALDKLSDNPQHDGLSFHASTHRTIGRPFGVGAVPTRRIRPISSR